MAKPTMFLPALVLSIGGAISGVTSAVADPITYTLQFIGNGSLGASPFPDSQVTLQFVGDTANIVNTSGFYENSVGTASVSVNGGAFVMFTDPIEVFSNQNAALGPVTVGFTDLNTGNFFDIVDDTNPALTGYALGPVGPTVGGTLTLGGSIYPTQGGDFNLTGVTYGDPNFPGSPTFTATVAVPAPPMGRGFAVALAVGSLLVCARLRKRQRCP
jgi:hypothetical protein